MPPKDDSLSLAFDLSKQSPFFFKCQRCSACCSNKTIKIEPSEILRLSRNFKINAKEFLETYCEGESAILKNKADGTCIFLDSNGCSVHLDRPLVCRLYPLGVIWNSEGKCLFGNMPPHPDCLGYFSDEGTVESYLESQGAKPYLFGE